MKNRKIVDLVMAKYNKKTEAKKGSITIFLSLIMFCLLEVFLLLLEMGRMEVMEYRANEIGRVSLDSTLAGFVRPAFDRYGILMYWGQKENLEKEIHTYIVNNLSAEEGKTDFFKMESTGVEVTQYTCITQENGEEMARQAETVVKYSLGRKAAEKLLEQCTKVQKGKEAQELFEDLEQEGEKIVSAQEELAKVHDCVKKISSLKTNPKSLAEELFLPLKEEKHKGEISPKGKKRIAKAYKKLKKTWQEHSKACTELRTAIENYHKKVDSLEDSVSQLEESLKKYKTTDIAAECANIQSDLKECSHQMSTRSDDNENRKEIDDIEKKVQEYGKNLDSCKQFLENHTDKDFMVNLDEYCKAVEIMCNELSDYEQTIPVMKENQNNDELKGFQKLLKSIKKGGLAFVVRDTKQLSAKEIIADNLPSITETYKKGNRNIDLQKIIFGQYCIDHFGYYTNKKQDTVLSYELEYLLGGKAGDQDNLEWVVKALLPIRAGFNVLHILKSPSKMGEAAALAVSICGWTGIPGLATLTKYILIQVWAYGESVIDVRDLLEGKKVPLVKNDGQWTLALSGLKSFGSKIKSSNTGDKGFDYQNYIRFLLAIQQKGIQYYRCMDLIQMNMNSKEKSFRMKDCVVCANAITTFYAQPLFLNFTGFGGKEQMYEIHGKTSGEYQ